MNYVKRNEWGAKKPRSRPSRAASTIYGLCVFAEGSETGLNTDKCHCDDAVRSIQTSNPGVADVKYNWLVCPHGRIFEGRGWGVRNAANTTTLGKTRYHAVAYLGGDNELTYDGKLGLKAVIDESRRKYGDEVECHGDLNELCEWVEAGAPEPEAPAEPVQEVPRVEARADEVKEEEEEPAFAFRYKKVVQEGDTGYAVTEWQEALHEWNEEVPEANGFFGDETDYWTRKFQEEAGLEADGVVGPETRAGMAKEN